MSSSQARTARQTAPTTRRARTGSGPPPPTVLGRYQLSRRLGSGAFGTVWLAHDDRLEREVAVKILPRERIVGGRFEREARAAARLAHPGIVTLYEAAVDDDGAYLVSELVRGATLDGLLEGGHLSDQDIVAIGIALCDALEHAHAEGVVHRDVKPSNVLVPARPVTPAQVAKLTDFGVARVIGGDNLTMTGDVIGTLAYMAPEQAEGLQAGPAADLYSLALVLYEALTGINPVRTTTAAHRARRLGAHLPPLRRQRRDLPRELGQGIDMALRPRPRERGTIRDLRRALVAAREHVDDEPGIVVAPWSPGRVGEGTGQRAGEGSGERAGEHEAWSASGEVEEDTGASPTFAWPARGLASIAAAASAGWLAAHLLSPSPLPIPVAAFVAAALVLVLPRLGWLALIVAVSALATAQGNVGFALVALPVLMMPVLLMVRTPTDWPLPAGAPALGLIGLAGAWPALAAGAATVWRRAALAATGWVWLLFAGAIAGRVLYEPHVPGTAPAAAWAGSPYNTVHQLLLPLARSGALTPALVWALAAAVLPWLVRGRSLPLDFVLVVIWAAMLDSATVEATSAFHGAHALAAPPTAVLGSVAAAVIALAARWHPRIGISPRTESHPAGSGGHFP